MAEAQFALAHFHFIQRLGACVAEMDAGGSMQSGASITAQLKGLHRDYKCDIGLITKVLISQKYQPSIPGKHTIYK